MSFSFLGGLASLLPGYIQGQRMANQDNWQDLMNYNQAQAGQQSNAFTEATWVPRLSMFRDEAVNSNLGMLGNLNDYRVKAFYQPYREMQAQAWSDWGPYLAPIGPQSQWDLWQYSRRTPGGLGALLGGTGGTPSAL